MSKMIEFIKWLDGIFPILKILIIIGLLIFAFSFVIKKIKQRLLLKTNSKIHRSNIKILARILNVSFVVLVVMFAFLSYLKSWTGIGVFLGLLTAALGFALQKPITGIAAWIMVIFKRPFNVGDRVTIGKVKGDVYDITLSHVYIDEVGGTVDSEQHSGRNIMVPNYLLFEETIINHTLLNELVLNEVVFSVTYESNLDKAMNIAHECAHKLTEKYASSINKDTKVRISLGDSGVIIRVLFHAPVQQLSKIKSDITKSIYDKIMKDKEVDFAYPHTTFISKDKKTNFGKKRK
jgi:small-conductance mechanosensitive channel